MNEQMNHTPWPFGRPQFVPQGAPSRFYLDSPETHARLHEERVAEYEQRVMEAAKSRVSEAVAVLTGFLRNDGARLSYLDGRHEVNRAIELLKDVEANL